MGLYELVLLKQGTRGDAVTVYRRVTGDFRAILMTL
jgi:hypothetical protein